MNTIFILVLIYVVLVACAYFFQQHLIYSPTIQRPVIPLRLGGRVEEMKVTTADGLTLEGWFMGPTGRNPIVVLFHGNAGHYGDRAVKAEIFANQGYGVLLTEYRGYGGNDGVPDEAGLYNDARAFLMWLFEQGFGSNDIILYGESIGCGVAIQMASEFETLGLVLETPFTSLSEAAVHHFPWLPVRYLIRDNYDNLSKIGTITEPILVLHGTSDRVVPYSMGEQLYRAAHKPKKLVTIRGGGHNNLYEWGVKKPVLKFLHEQATGKERLG